MATGSGQTYRGVKPGYYSELASITGQFYSNGRVYYTLPASRRCTGAGSSPRAASSSQVENTVTGADFSTVAGLTLLGRHAVLRQQRPTARCTRCRSPAARPTRAPTAIVTPPGVDWRARGLFLYGPATFPNQPPSASATVSCTGLGCSFDARRRTDPDGSIAGLRLGLRRRHHGHRRAGRATATRRPGARTVTLTVTDDRGATAAWSGTASPDASGPAVGFDGAARLDRPVAAHRR